ncbi:MAG: hypothetical protein ACJ8KO_14070, partial [Sulfurifustaceae bacterium]
MLRRSFALHVCQRLRTREPIFEQSERAVLKTLRRIVLDHRSATRRSRSATDAGTGAGAGAAVTGHIASADQSKA